MLFQWDSGNISHIALHDVTPDEAEQVVENEPLDVGAVFRNGEERIVHLGETNAGRVLVVVITERDGIYRVVTARPSRREERALYSRQKATSHDQDTGNS